MARSSEDHLEEVYSVYSRDSTTELSPDSSSSHSTMDLSEPSLIPFTRNQGEKKSSPLLTYSPNSPNSPFFDSRGNSAASSPTPSLYRQSPPNSLMISTSGSSAFASRPAHLRKRSQPSGPMSLGSDSGTTEHYRSESNNPFENTAYQVAMSREGSVSSHDVQAGTAMGMRGDRAEWVPTQHHLYSESSLSHDDASRALSKTPSLSGSTRKYDLAVLSPEVLNSYEKARYSKEDDDALHEPGPKGMRAGRDRRILETNEFRGSTPIFTARAWINLGGLAILLGGLVMLFAGYPIVDYFTKNSLGNFGAVGLGGTNSSGQVPNIPAFRGLIDKDTPSNVMSRTGFDGKAYQLVFSDEFDESGRTFYPGDDPFWEAVDLHYWQTNNLEWYDPGNIVTKDGYLAISLTKESLADSHGLGYLGGLLQSWNKFCFTGGYLEVAISLPGDNVVQGLWPAAWSMGNLGRAGYGGSLDGNWPYTYDSCDVGTLPNQTLNGVPAFNSLQGDQYHEGALSYLPGQRLSACTCPGENHPGPILKDGSFPGRAASEIDIFEATVNPTIGAGQISQSAQWGPYNVGYVSDNTSANFQVYQTPFGSVANEYVGGVYQQVSSVLSTTNPLSYNSTTVFESYGFEYTPTYINGQGTGEITWTQNNQAMWKILDTAMGPDPVSKISARPVTGEPLYIMLNLGMSSNFGYVDLKHLTFPAVMRVDYVRVYQPTDRINIGCSPPLYPTAEYIARNIQGYTDPNVTILADMGQTFPKNRLTSKC